MRCKEWEAYEHSWWLSTRSACSLGAAVDRAGLNKNGTEEPAWGPRNSLASDGKTRNRIGGGFRPVEDRREFVAAPSQNVEILVRPGFDAVEGAK